jgi:hypothetical protein
MNDTSHRLSAPSSTNYWHLSLMKPRLFMNPLCNIGEQESCPWLPLHICQTLLCGTLATLDIIPIITPLIVLCPASWHSCSNQSLFSCHMLRYPQLELLFMRAIVQSSAKEVCDEYLNEQYTKHLEPCYYSYYTFINGVQLCTKKLPSF